MTFARLTREWWITVWWIETKETADMLGQLEHHCRKDITYDKSEHREESGWIMPGLGVWGEVSGHSRERDEGKSQSGE